MADSIAQVGHTSVQETTGAHSKVVRQRSSRNATKHGIFSEVAVLPGESHEKYQSLVRKLWKALQPEGRLEELLVEKLTSLVWRHRRLLVAEGAEIRGASEFWEWDKQNQERQQDPAKIFDKDRCLISQIQNRQILSRCLGLLDNLRKRLESDGENGIEGSHYVLAKIYGPDNEFPKSELREKLYGIFSQWLVSPQVRSLEGYATPEQCKERVLAAIEEEMLRLRDYEQKHASIESRRAKVEVLRRSIPESVGLDRLLRYEASLERGFDRTLNQLERIQRLRKGQPVAPRIDVSVSRDG